MSAIFNDEGSVSAWESNWISSGVQITDLPSVEFLDPQPDTSKWADPDTGISLSGILSGVSATADSLASVFGKVYNIQNAAANQKFAQEVTRAQLDLQRAQTLGGLDVAKTKTEAENRIELARAALGVKNAEAQMNSPGALRVGNTAIPQNVWVAVIVAGVAYLIAKRSKK